MDDTCFFSLLNCFPAPEFVEEPVLSSALHSRLLTDSISQQYQNLSESVCSVKPESQIQGFVSTQLESTHK